MGKLGRICLNWKVIAGLAMVGLGIWLLAPEAAAAALPLLIVAACPLSMLLMMRGMQGMQGSEGSQCASQPHAAQPQQTGQVEVPAGAVRAEQLAELKAQLARTQAQQEAIAREIARLEAASAPAVREAETVARLADERAHQRS